MGSGGGDRGVSPGVRASARGDRPAAGTSRLDAPVVAAAAQRPQCQSSIAGARGRIPAATHGDLTPGQYMIAVALAGALLIKASGRVVYENPALRRLLACDPDARQLEADCIRLGTLIIALATRQGAKTQTQEI